MEGRSEEATEQEWEREREWEARGVSSPEETVSQSAELAFLEEGNSTLEAKRRLEAKASSSLGTGARGRRGADSRETARRVAGRAQRGPSSVERSSGGIDEESRVMKKIR